MYTIYDTKIPDTLTSEYLNFLVGKVFSLLPLFEESRQSKECYQSFEIYQANLIQTINGNFDLIKYDDFRVVDILSHLQALYEITDHSDYKRHILKVCKVISQLKDEVDKNGLR